MRTESFIIQLSACIADDDRAFKTMLSDDFGGKKNCRKRPKFWHVDFVSSEKHCPEVFFFAGLLFGFENGRMQKGYTGWKS